MKLKPASSNPRVDIVVQMPAGFLRRLFRRPGKTKIIAGTPTPGALLDNRLGAAPVPAGAVHLSDVYVPHHTN
jgi:hypothetical protein